jgi:hypothetical protein
MMIAKKKPPETLKISISGGFWAQKLASTKVTKFWTTRGVSPPGTTGHSIGANRFDRSQTLLTFGGFKVARFSLVVDKVIIEMYRIV